MIKRIYLLLILTSTAYISLFGQNNDTWSAFWNNDTSLIGYKDKNGVERIEPKFSAYQSARRFDNIIVVSEKSNGGWKSYYLTKTGKIVGRDSIYFLGSFPDCENEGFIRFKDYSTDKVGMFNKEGDIVIPAEYNSLSMLRNGMIIALKGAEKEHQLEYYNWIGGQKLLIDTNNTVLIDNFDPNNYLNFYSLEKTKTPHSDSTRKSFIARDGSFYSFVDYEKEFEQWLKNNLITDLTPEKLKKYSFDTISFEASNNWVALSSGDYIADNLSIIKKDLFDIFQPNCDYFISKFDLEPFKFYPAGFSEKYCNNCMEIQDWIYPAMIIGISQKNNKNSIRNCYVFLRTDNEYKLLSVTLVAK